ncbi:Hypothetical protein FKW44_014057, partial [Caligus rogercresseyi]
SFEHDECNHQCYEQNFVDPRTVLLEKKERHKPLAGVHNFMFPGHLDEFSNMEDAFNNILKLIGILNSE